MKNVTTILGAILFFGVSASAFGDEEFGDWTVSFGQRYLEHIVENGPGNRFIVSCDLGASEDHRGTGLLVTIIGKDPPPLSTVKVILDGKEVAFGASETGSIKADCHACSEAFEHFWRNIRRARSMLVQLSDGRSSSFSLKGVAKALGPKVCRTGYMGR